MIELPSWATTVLEVFSYAVFGLPLARIGPYPETVTETLRTQAGRDLAGAFGVPPSLLNPSGDGAGQREAWRRFWAGSA